MERLLSLAFTCILAVLHCRPAAAQVVTNDSLKDQLYMYRVKSVDEFMERFNNDQDAYIYRQLRKRKSGFAVSRQDMIRHLFDADRPGWNKEDVGAFFAELFGSGKPYLLHFADSNWCVVAQAAFTYEGRPLNIPLRMRIKNTEPAGARWVICGLGDHPLPAAGDYPAAQATPATRLIVTSSHVDNFLALNDAFNDIANLPVYFDPAFVATGKANGFMKALADHKLVFSQVSSQQFYFFQVANWVFRLSKVERSTANQGWLITAVTRVAETDKVNFFH